MSLPLTAQQQILEMYFMSSLIAEGQSFWSREWCFFLYEHVRNIAVHGWICWDALC